MDQNQFFRLEKTLEDIAKAMNHSSTNIVNRIYDLKIEIQNLNKTLKKIKNL